LAISGYLVVIALFLGMVIFCFLWGILEYLKPKDPGPLFIDLDRSIRKRLRRKKFNTGEAPDKEHAVHSKLESTMGESCEASQFSELKETIRVKGDLRIPKGEIIPYNMIVDGNLTSQKDVIFQGGLHVKGRVVIGARNRLEKSIVCQKELFLSKDVTVNNCIDCEGLILIKKGLKVGASLEGGGIASRSTIFLEKPLGPLRIKSKKGVRVVDDLNDVIPQDLKPIIEVVSA
jgi:hypothetical protein